MILRQTFSTGQLGTRHQISGWCAPNRISCPIRSECDWRKQSNSETSLGELLHPTTLNGRRPLFIKESMHSTPSVFRRVRLQHVHRRLRAEFLIRDDASTSRAAVVSRAAPLVVLRWVKRTSAGHLARPPLIQPMNAIEKIYNCSLAFGLY